MQNNSNKNWENNGWEAMRQTLDRELPVDKKPKRRLLLWYWAAGIAALTGVVFMNIQSMDSNFKDLSDKETITSEFPSSIASNEKRDFQEFELNAQDVGNQHFAQKENEASKIIHKPGISEKTAEIPIFSNENKKSDLIKTTVSGKVPKLKNLSNTSATVDTKSTELPKQKEITRLPLLAGELNFSKTDIPGLPRPTIESTKMEKTAPIKQGIKTTFGLSGSGLVALDARFNGFQSGVFVEFGKTTSKFSVRTGLNYRFSRQREYRTNWVNNFGRSITAESDTDSPDGTITAGNTGNQDGSFYAPEQGLIIVSQNQNYHILSLPVNLRYRFHPKWSASLGTETSRLLSSPSAQFAADPLSSPSFRSFNIKKLDLATTGGIHFFPAQQWTLSLIFHHGNLLKGNAWQIDNRFFSLGSEVTF